MTTDSLLTAARLVDVLDAAGRILGNPKRNAPAAPAAEVLALAFATERFWAIALEADLLVRALSLPVTGNDDQDAARDAAIQHQSDEVKRLMAAIRGEPTNQENVDGSSYS